MDPDEFRESLTCPRCESEMEFAGTREFHEGTRLGDFLGGLFDLLDHREALDAYVCKLCGKVEFYLAGVGEELRGGTPLRDVALEIEANARPVTAAIPPIPPAAPPPENPDSLAPAEKNWTCSQCGEKNPENFEICWRCVTPRN